MKKVLSVILAIVMIVACVPVISAYEYPEPARRFFDAIAALNSKIGFGIYTKDGITAMAGMFIGEDEEIFTEVFDAIGEALDNSGIHDIGLKKLIEKEPEKVEEITDLIDEWNIILEEWYAENGYTIVIDASRYHMPELSGIYYDDETNDAFVAFMEENVDMQKYEELLDLYNDDIPYLLEKVILEGVGTVTQEEFDEKTYAISEFMGSALDCFEGNHTFTEYTDLGDGTHRADCTFCKAGEAVEAHTFGEHIPDDNGTTATAKCDKCDATDIIEVEWEDLPAEDDSNFFTALIATIRDFFAGIVEFFKNLFA